MKISQRVRRILSNYAGEPPGVVGNLARILMEGKLGGTGKMIILQVDQGIEHKGHARPSRSPIRANRLERLTKPIPAAIDAGLNDYAPRRRARWNARRRSFPVKDARHITRSKPKSP